MKTKLLSILYLIFVVSLSAYGDDHYNDLGYDPDKDRDNPADGCYTAGCDPYSEYQDPYGKYQDPYGKYQDPYGEYQDPYSDKFIPNCKYTGAC